MACANDCDGVLSMALLGVRAVVWLMLPLSVSEMPVKRFLSERESAASSRRQSLDASTRSEDSSTASNRWNCGSGSWPSCPESCSLSISAEGAASRRASNCLLASLSMCACAEKEEHRKTPKAKSNVPNTEREKLAVASLTGFSVFMCPSIKPNGGDVNNAQRPFSGISHAKSRVRACLSA